MESIEIARFIATVLIEVAIFIPILKISIAIAEAISLYPYYDEEFKTPVMLILSETLMLLSVIIFTGMSIFS